MANIKGTYKLEETIGFDEFLKELGKFLFIVLIYISLQHILICFISLGVNFMLRQMAKTAKPSIEISISDDNVYTIKTITLIKTTSISFKLGEEFDETRQDGKTVKVRFLINKRIIRHLHYNFYRVRSLSKATTNLCMCRKVTRMFILFGNSPKMVWKW